MWFSTGIGTGTTIIELKISHELAIVDQGPLLLLLLDLRNTYDNLERGRLTQKLAGYGTGPKLWGLLVEFWSRQEVVTRHNSFHEPQLQSTIGRTQVRPALPTLFNVAADSVIRHWLSLTVEDDSVAHEDLGMVVGRFMGVFYEDNGMVGLRDPECLQGAINFLIGLFRRFNLIYNLEKSKTMTCDPGAIFTGVSEESFIWRSVI